MTRNYTQPAQQSIRERSLTHSRQTSQQSQHGRSSGSSSTARDPLVVVLDGQSPETRPHLDTNITGSRRRDLDMIRARHESRALQEYCPRHDTTEASRDHSMSRTQHETRLDLDKNRPRQESRALQEYRPRSDTIHAGRDHGMSRTEHGFRPRRDTNYIDRTQQESRPVRDMFRTPMGGVGAYRYHEEITERWPREMERIERGDRGGGRHETIIAPSPREIERIERDDCAEGHREMHQHYTGPERDPIMSLRTIEARRRNRQACIDRVMERGLSRMGLEDRREAR